VLFKMANSHFSSYFLGKTGFYILLYFAYTCCTFLVAYPIFDLPLNGNILVLLTVTFLFFTTTILYTWVVASFFKSQTRAMEIMAFTSYPLFLITGITWPFKDMPWFIQGIGNLIPLRPYFQFLKKQTIMGVDSALYRSEIIQILLLLFLAYGIALWRFYYLKKQVIS